MSFYLQMAQSKKNAFDKLFCSGLGELHVYQYKLGDKVFKSQTKA
jgi:hypothetical protein